MACRGLQLPPETVREALMSLSSEALPRLLRIAKVPRPHPTRKAEMTTVLDKLLSGKSLRALWSALNPLQQTALAEAVCNRFGSFNGEQFRAKYGAVPAGYHSDSYQMSILRLFLYPQNNYGPPVFMPAELARRLRDFVPMPEPATLATENELPDGVKRIHRFARHMESEEEIAALTQRDMERAAQQDLPAVLRLIDSGKVAVSAKTGRASATAMSRIADVLTGGDFYDLEKPKERWQQVPGPIRAFAWPWLMQSGRLATQRGSKLELTQAGRQALGRPAAETLSLLWQRWMKNKLLDEFNRVDVFKGQTGKKGKRAMTSPASRRPKVESALRDCPVGRWVSVSEFWRYMRAADYDFEVSLETWRLYLVDPHYGTLDRVGWSMMQGRYVSCLLLEYAATLGMIDVAITPPALARDDFSGYWGTDELDYLSRYDGLWHFRLNPLGAYCLELADQYEPSIPFSQGAVTVFPDRRVRTVGELSFDEKLLLDLYAKAESEDTWRLDGDKVLSALESGHDLAELRDFLEQRDDQPLPDMVEGFFRRMERNAVALKSHGDALLVECADEEVVARMLGDKRTAKLCMPAGERHLVVPAKAVARFRKAVRGLGFGISVA